MTYAARAQYRRGWQAASGWVHNYTLQPPVWTTFKDRQLPDLEAPDYFETEQPVAEMMTVGQLRRYVQELSASGLNVVPQAVELHRKMAFPFVTFVMALLAVPFGVSMGRRGTLYGIGIGIVLALSYWIVSSLFVAIGKGGLLAPVLAGWAPNIIVLGTACYLFLTVKTTPATSPHQAREDRALPCYPVMVRALAVLSASHWRVDRVGTPRAGTARRSDAPPSIVWHPSSAPPARRKYLRHAGRTPRPLVRALDRPAARCSD